MKICPACNQHYSDDSLTFCTEDGTPLYKSTKQEFKTVSSSLVETIPAGKISNSDLPTLVLSNADAETLPLTNADLETIALTNKETVSANTETKSDKTIPTPKPEPTTKNVFSSFVEKLNQNQFGKTAIGTFCGIFLGLIYVPLVSLILKSNPELTWQMRVKNGAIGGAFIGIFFGLIIGLVFNFIGEIQKLKLPNGIYGLILGAITGISISVISQYLMNNYEANFVNAVTNFYELGGKQIGSIVYGAILGLTVDVLSRFSPRLPL